MAKPEIPEETQDESVNDGASTSQGGNSSVDGLQNGHIRGLGFPRVVRTVTTIPLRITATRQIDVHETQMEGQELFVEFLQEQIQQEHVEVPADLRQFMNNSQPHPSVPSLAETGHTLRTLADEFARSEGRKRVYDEAQRAVSGIENVTKDDFLLFLQNFFVDNQNPRERIVTLFFFCSDVIISSMKEKLYKYAKNFIEWSINFIVERVCQWVAEKGGWNAMFGLVAQSVQRALKYIGAATIITAIVAVSIAYYWKGK